MRIQTSFLLACALTSFGFSQDWAKKELDASPRHQEWASIKHGDRTVKSFVVFPEINEKAHVVVLIHEIMGMTEWVQLTADLLAKEGYIAIAPDLLSEMGPNKGRTDSFGELGKVRETISGLDPKQVMADLDAVSEYGKKLPASNGTFSVAGFCWGGSQSWNYAVHQPNLKAAYVFYGTAPESTFLQHVKAPVFGFYASNDARVNASLAETEKAVDEHDLSFEKVIYEGAGHGFMRAGQDPSGSEGNKGARQAAWKRWMGLLKSVHR